LGAFGQLGGRRRRGVVGRVLRHVGDEELLAFSGLFVLLKYFSGILQISFRFPGIMG